MRSTTFLLLLGLALYLASPAQGAKIVGFGTCKIDDGAGGHVYCADIDVYMSGATNVQLWDGSSSSWVDFTHPAGSDEFYLDTPDFSSLADLNNAIGGAGKMRVHTSSGYATYTFSVGNAAEAMFPVVPSITPDPFPGQVQQNYTFNWTWGGNTNDVDNLYVEAMVDTGGGMYYFEAESAESTILKTATSWAPNFSHNGDGEFLVGYGVSGSLVTGWTYDGGDSTIADVFDFGGQDTFHQAICSEDEECDFEVIPEPSTVALLLLGTTWACMHRKRKR